MKKVSVVIPTYNHSSYVLDAIKSVKASEGVEAEIVVVNDGSPDDSHELLKDLPGIRYFLTENRGAHAALNFGIEKSTHEIIAILNDDDLFSPEHLLGSILELEATGADIVISRYEAFGEGKFLEQIRNHTKIADQRIGQFGLLKTLLQINWAVSTSSFTFRRGVFQATGGFSSLTMCHDYEFLLSALVNSQAAIFYSNRTDWLYRCHDQNSSHSVNQEDRRAQWYAATFVSYEFLPQHIQAYLSEIALEHLGIDSELLDRILIALSTVERSEINLGVERIKKLLISPKKI
jgi:glycosyltransferase involved in cell wall biosynthesis